MLKLCYNLQYMYNCFAEIKSASCSGNAYDFVLLCSDVAKAALVGQFVHIKADGFYLRRPISICEISGDCIRIVFEVRGEGTAELSKLSVGDSVDILAPLGKGFTIPRGEVFVVGGGIGVPPLLEAVKQAESAKAFLGFRNAESVILQEDFSKFCDTTVTLEPEFVTFPLKKALESGRPSAILACGPAAMLKAVSALAEEFNVPCQVSLEQRMACGVGACLVCSCQTKYGVKHVCKDGPVFDAREVVW
jgi:2-polyprenylphenol hydroxylase and related flavodoxin oxidoreductases